MLLPIDELYKLIYLALENQLLGLIYPAIIKEKDSFREYCLLIKLKGVIPLKKGSKEKTNEVNKAIAKYPLLI